MQKTKKSGLIFLILLNPIIFSLILISCNQEVEKGTIQTDRNEEKQNRLLGALETSGIPVDNSVVLFLPPTSCKACIYGVSDVIDSFPDAFIYYASINENDKIEKLPTQTYVPYDKSILLKKGIMRYYAELIIIRNGEIVETRAISKK